MNYSRYETPDIRLHGTRVWVATKEMYGALGGAKLLTNLLRFPANGRTEMNVHAVEPDVEAGALLAGARFIDAYAITTDDAALDARHAAEKMLGRSPRWALTLLALRDLCVAPFGLKTAETARRSSTNRIGMFPVLSETPQRIVAGLNDSHLDFRVVVDVAGSGAGRSVTATTVVLTHNLLGRIYLAIILPFHRLIVRAMLRQIAR
jgi:hypothetical protein